MKNEISRWNCGSLTPNGTRLANSIQVRQLPAAVSPEISAIRPSSTPSASRRCGSISQPGCIEALRLGRGRAVLRSQPVSQPAVDADDRRHEHRRDREHRPPDPVGGVEHRGVADRAVPQEVGHDARGHRADDHRDDDQHGRYQVPGPARQHDRAAAGAGTSPAFGRPRLPLPRAPGSRGAAQRTLAEARTRMRLFTDGNLPAPARFPTILVPGRPAGPLSS